MSRVVHVLLEGSIEVGEGLGATSKPEALAEVVTTLRAVATFVAHDASLDCYSLANHKILDTRADCSYDASGLMTEDQGCLEGEVAVPTVDIIMDWEIKVRTQVCGDGYGSKWRRTVASTETGGDDLDLSLIWTWRPEGTCFVAEILGTVENGGVLFEERRRHGRGDGKLRIKLTTASTVFKLLRV